MVKIYSKLVRISPRFSVRISTVRSMCGTLISVIKCFCIRPETLLLQLAENALGAKPALTMNLPLYQQLKECDGVEMANLIQLRTVCFSKSTWFSSSSGLKPYLKFCESSKKDPYPVDRTLLELCVLLLYRSI